MKLLLSLTCLFLFSIPVYADFSVEANGADPSAAASTNTNAIQTALDAAGVAGGGRVTVTKAGVYLLAYQGANPYGPSGHKYCLDFKYNNITFFIGAGVTLKLANGQQANGAPVDVIVFAGRKNLVFEGAGSNVSGILGNTAGQTGWSQGYSQIDHGIIISSYGIAGGLANSNIHIRHLTLSDHFSNPINIDAHPSNARNSNIHIEDITADGCGEGIQVVQSDGVWIKDSAVTSVSHVAVGDAFEVSDCRQFFITNDFAANHWSGSGFDVFGSTDGLVDGWLTDDSANGMEIHSFGGLPNPKNVTATNGMDTNPRDASGTSVCDGVALNAPALTNVRVSNFTMQGTQYSYGIQIHSGSETSTTGPVFIENCNVNGGVDGILIATAVSDLTIKGGSYSNMSNRGIVYAFQGNGLTAAQLKNFNVSGVTAINNGSYGLALETQGFTVPAFSGSITDCYMENNGTGPLKATAEVMGLTIENVIPNAKSLVGDFWGTNPPIVYGLKFLSPTGGNLRGLQLPSKNQVLTVTFPEATTVFDARQTGGNNLYLSQGVNGTFKAGDSLTLRSEGTVWREVSRSLNTP